MGSILAVIGTPTRPPKSRGKSPYKKTMYTTVNENGVLNNYPTEPQVYCAQYPAVWEKRNYVIQGAIATIFVTPLVLVAIAVS